MSQKAKDIITGVVILVLMAGFFITVFAARVNPDVAAMLP